jgi:DNA-binding transcriptional ArsR family regulator
MAAVELFRALGDPVRLEIMRRLSRRDRWTINSLSDGLGQTRQGVRRHIQVLADVHLIHLEPKGREVYVELDAEGIAEAKVFIAEIERQWDRRLEALKRFVEETEATNE